MAQEADWRSSQPLGATHHFSEPLAGLDLTDKSPESRTSSHHMAGMAGQGEVHVSTCWPAGHKGS